MFTLENLNLYIEDKLLKLLKSWDLPAEKTIASGSMKNVSTRVKGQEYLFTSDLYTEGIVKSNRVRIESKKRTYNAFKKYYELVNDCYSYLHIKNFCYIFNQSAFYNLIKGKHYGIGADKDDKQHKSLHNFFDQDNSGIVTLISPDPNSNKYLPFLFCITEELFNQIIEERKRGN